MFVVSSKVLIIRVCCPDNLSIIFPFLKTADPRNCVSSRSPVTFNSPATYSSSPLISGFFSLFVDVYIAKKRSLPPSMVLKKRKSVESGINPFSIPWSIINSKYLWGRVSILGLFRRKYSCAFSLLTAKKLSSLISLSLKASYSVVTNIGSFANSSETIIIFNNS